MSRKVPDNFKFFWTYSYKKKKLTEPDANFDPIS